jgi:hypothetical protein
MSNERPITPPPGLLKQWEDDWFEEREHADVLLIQAFQAGADQELEACCEWISGCGCESYGRELRAARRKPPSLKEQALAEIDALENMGACNSNTIRRALEALPND